MGRQYISKNNSGNMKILIALALLFAVAVATPSTTTCEQKNEILKDALVRLTKPEPKVDCSTCYDDILAAVADCFFSGTWLQCIQDILGGANPCIDCVCEVITDVCAALGCGFSCLKLNKIFFL